MSNEVVSIAFTAAGIAVIYGWGSLFDEYLKFKTKKSLKDYASDFFEDFRNYRKV